MGHKKNVDTNDLAFMIFANKKILGEQTQYVAKRHTERLQPNKTRYEGPEGSPLQRFSP